MNLELVTWLVEKAISIIRRLKNLLHFVELLVKFAVVAGSASKDLGKRIARRLKAPYVEAKIRVFPDGESKITFGRIPKNSVILVVQSTYPPVDTNLLQTLSIISQAR